MERPYNSVLIVTHGGVMKAFQHLFLNVGLEEAFCLNIPYASILEYELH
jgi:broad specificity phosphatase PhoE